MSFFALVLKEINLIKQIVYYIKGKGFIPS
jgi:hypothetical protein